MGIFDKISKSINIGRKENSEDTRQLSEHQRSAIPYGGNKLDGTHDHRRNTGGDRTPAQKKADQGRKKTD